jgi:hypothetical protein
MTPEQFAYWFQGFAELSPTPPTQEQWDSIREHLALVFKKVTSPVKEVQNPLTPKPETESEMLQRLMRQYQEAKQKRGIDWLEPRPEWEVPGFDWFRNLPRETLIC